MLRFPKSFLFGAATSAHQVEGDSDDDWTSWEAAASNIRDGNAAGKACAWWDGSAEPDLALAAELGHHAHRMSLAWSRLEPEPGRYDDGAFERYRRILRAGREAGLVFMVTLNHFTLPRWLAERGGWLDRRIVERFERFAVRCLEELGDEVALWATLNEPSVLAYMGYAGRRWPPGLSDAAAGVRALRTMLVSHARAYHAMHRLRDDVVVGLVHNAPLFAAASGVIDRGMAAAQDWAFTGVVMRAFRSGWLLPPLAPSPRRVSELVGSLDFLGLNYYGLYRVAFDPAARDTFYGRHVQWPTIRTEWTDWGEPHAEGLTEQLVRFARLGVPLYVTENGIFDNHDVVRPQYLLDHVRAVHAALARGVDVRGYFHWSLVDNFEWAEGWAAHFGLVAVDRVTQAREPKQSARIFESICRQRAVTMAPPEVERVIDLG